MYTILLTLSLARLATQMRCWRTPSPSNGIAERRYVARLVGGNYLNGGVIEHFLPGIVELPLVRIGHKLLLGQCHRLLGGHVDFCRVAECREIAFNIM